MKRVSSRQLPGLLAEVQLTPVLDLVLMLMLAVLVLAPTLREAKLEAAGTATAVHDVPKKTLELAVAADLKLTLAGTAVDEGALIGELKKRVEADPHLGVMLSVPPELKSPALLQLMEALRSAGVQHTAVTTKPLPLP